MTMRAASALLMAIGMSAVAVADPTMKPSVGVVRTKTYFETSAFKDCKANATCQIYFSKISGGAVIFRRVTCVATHQTPIILSAFGLAKDKSNNSLEKFATLAIPEASSGGLRYSQFNQEVFIRLENGDLPSASVIAPDSSQTSLSCIATGTPD